MAMLPNTRTMLELLIGQAQQAPLVLRLYGNQKTPSVNDRVVDFDPIGDNRYASALLPSNWVIADGPPLVAVHTEVVIRFDGPAEVFGYYVTAGDHLLWAERFENGPYQIHNNGDEIRLTPALALGGA